MHHTLGHLQGPWPPLNRQEHFAHRIDGRPHPGALKLQALAGVLFTDLAGVEVTDRGVQLVELGLVAVYLTEQIT